MTHTRAAVVDMQEELDRHPDDEVMERYALGTLPETAIAAFEQHLLVCAGCQDRMAEMDANVQALQAEAREIRLREKPRQSMCNGGSQA